MSHYHWRALPEIFMGVHHADPNEMLIPNYGHNSSMRLTFLLMQLQKQLFLRTFTLCHLFFHLFYKLFDIKCSLNLHAKTLISVKSDSFWILFLYIVKIYIAAIFAERSGFICLASSIFRIISFSKDSWLMYYQSKEMDSLPLGIPQVFESILSLWNFLLLFHHW